MVDTKPSRVIGPGSGAGLLNRVKPSRVIGPGSGAGLLNRVIFFEGRFAKNFVDKHIIIG